MSEAISTRLYSLLPELYRWRDEQQGKPLQALLAILEREFHALEVDTEAMYDNWFIQTCDNWVVPYLADLLGIRDQIVQIDYLPFTQRRRVANTLAYRRRKGTVAVLEQVLWDVTNWHVRAVEFYRLLATTQHLQHLRGDQVASVNLKDIAALSALESPFSILPRSSEIRSAALGTAKVETDSNQQTVRNPAQQTTRGKYSPHNLGLFFWRLRPYPVNRGFPKQRKEGSHLFTFSPTGHDTQIFNRPQSFLALEQRATAINMPILVTRAELAADLSNYRRQYKNRPIEQQPLHSTYYGADRSFNITDLREIFLFDMKREPIVITELNKGILGNILRQTFADEGVLLSQNSSARPIEKDKRWQIEDASLGKSYRLNAAEQMLGVFRIREQILPLHILSVDLSEWPSLNTLRAYYVDDTRADLVAVDPELGRFAFLKLQTDQDECNTPERNAQNICVDYTYGFSGDVGGGPYPRHFAPDNTWQNYREILVAVGCQNSKLEDVAEKNKVLVAHSVGYALTLWNRYCEQTNDKPRALIRILDNGIYKMDKPVGSDEENSDAAKTIIKLPVGAELAIVAEDGVQPTLDGQLEIRFPQPPVRTMEFDVAATPREPVATLVEEVPVVDRKLRLNGLRMVGGLVVEKVERATINALDLVIEHCSLIKGGIDVELEAKDAFALNLSIQRSIVGPLRVPPNMAGLRIAESIIDSQLMSQTVGANNLNAYALAAPVEEDNPGVKPGPPTTIERSTIFGKVYVQGSLHADAVLFGDPVTVKPSIANPSSDGVKGMLRYCYLPAGSEIPACDYCLHEDEKADCSETCFDNISRPVFSSQRYGRPGYAQLSHLSADEILYGVGNIAEIGVFHHLYQPQREANIQIMLDEYMPLGLDAGVFHVT